MKNRKFFIKFFEDTNANIIRCESGGQVYDLYLPDDYQYHNDVCKLLGCGFAATCSRFGFSKIEKVERHGILQLFNEK